MDVKQLLVTKWKQLMSKAFKNGFFHIIGGNTAVKIISFLSSFLLVNIIAKNQMGMFTLPNNIVNMVLLFSGLGMSSAMLRYCTVIDNEPEKKAYFQFGVRFGMLFNVVLVVLAAGFLYVLNYYGMYKITSTEAWLLLALSLTPFFAFGFDMIQTLLRSERDNVNYARTSVVFTGAYGILQVLFVLFMQVNGIIPGRYLAYLVTIAVGLYAIRKKGYFQQKPIALRKYVKTGIVKYGFTVFLANCFSLVMPYIETFILCYFVADKGLRAEFNVASIPPQSIGFLANSVMVFIFPYFARNYKDGRWLLKNTKKVYLGMIAGMAVVVTIGMLITPWIVRFYGKSYYNSEEIAIMRIFWVAFGINSALKMPTGNILAAVGEVKFNTINAILSTTIQTIICWMLISRFLVNGAAYGLLFGYLVSSIIGILYLIYYCKRLIKRKEQNPPAVQIEDDVS
jgi:O-antigen/teichoic acid export membrane protein